MYTEFSVPTDQELNLVVELNHSFVAKVIGRDPVKPELYFRMLYVDVLVERWIRRRGENVPARTFRASKDIFSRKMETT